MYCMKGFHFYWFSTPPKSGSDLSVSRAGLSSIWRIKFTTISVDDVEGWVSFHEITGVGSPAYRRRVAGFIEIVRPVISGVIRVVKVRIEHFVFAIYPGTVLAIPSACAWINKDLRTINRRDNLC